MHTPVLIAGTAAMLIAAAPVPAQDQNNAALPPPAIPAGPPPGQKAQATVWGKSEIQGILGKDVHSTVGEDMGRIVDVLVDRSGQARAVIIDFGGFLGVGSRKIAVDWNALHFSPGTKPESVSLDLTKDQVRAAPEFKENTPVVVLSASGGTQPVPDLGPF
jgi:hypothetical protein